MTSSRIQNLTANELHATLRPINSLISKSEKAKQKLALGSWQHTMLQNNIKALHLASILLTKEADYKESFTQNEFQEALAAFDSMILKTEKSQKGFLIGTSQHTLQYNRLKALRVARAHIKAEQGATATS